MPKIPTFPTLFNDALQISISKLKEWEYLKPEQVKSGTLTWSRNGTQTASISITANTKSERPYLELAYLINKELIKYRVQLTTMPSNIGKGVLWYFICPKTGTRCRKLHFVNSYFYHRTAFKDCFYETQTISSCNREMKKIFESYFGRDKINKQLQSKHFKSHYAGNPTKQFLRLIKKIDTYQEILYEEYLRISSQ